jgi:hypothetical protein
MINLEDHIRAQRDLLDSEQPREGHEERFLQKLYSKPSPRLQVRHVLQIAASLAILITSGIVLVNLKKSGDKVASQEVPASVIEADMYYASQMDARYEQIRNFSFEDMEEKTLLLDELKDLDKYHQQLMNDLEANPDDDRVISALIRHYQIKLEVMDQIIMQLNQIKSETSKNHENESV